MKLVFCPFKTKTDSLATDQSDSGKVVLGSLCHLEMTNTSPGSGHTHVLEGLRGRRRTRQCLECLEGAGMLKEEEVV